MTTLTPAYGRDYKNKNDVITDFNNNKDFIINDMFSPYNGKSCNKSDIKNVYKSVKIRYNKLQKICIVKL
jgi:hypothetical protein